MCGCYEIIFKCARNHSGKVADYLRHYDFGRIDPITEPENSYFSVYGKCHVSELYDIVLGLNHDLTALNIQIEIEKIAWMKDE